MNIDNFIVENDFIELSIINPRREDILYPLCINNKVKGVIYYLEFDINVHFNHSLCDIFQVDIESEPYFNILFNNKRRHNDDMLIISTIPKCALQYTEIIFQSKNVEPHKIKIKCFTLQNNIRKFIKEQLIVNNFGLIFEDNIITNM